MPELTPTAYDIVEYPDQWYAQTHPDRLASIATLHGMNPPPPEQCRVLELGWIVYPILALGLVKLLVEDLRIGNPLALSIGSSVLHGADYSDDPDGDGYDTSTEVTDLIYDNTPTFPGLKSSNLGGLVNVTVTDIYDPGSSVDFVTPSGGSDTTPPDVTILWPVGGESIPAGTYSGIDRDVASFQDSAKR